MSSVIESSVPETGSDLTQDRQATQKSGAGSLTLEDLGSSASGSDGWIVRDPGAIRDYFGADASAVSRPWASTMTATTPANVSSDGHSSFSGSAHSEEIDREPSTATAALRFAQESTASYESRTFGSSDSASGSSDRFQYVELEEYLDPKYTVTGRSKMSGSLPTTTGERYVQAGRIIRRTTTGVSDVLQRAAPYKEGIQVAGECVGSIWPPAAIIASTAISAVNAQQDIGRYGRLAAAYVSRKGNKQKMAVLEQRLARPSQMGFAADSDEDSVTEEECSDSGDDAASRLGEGSDQDSDISSKLDQVESHSRASGLAGPGRLGWDDTSSECSSAYSFE